MQDNYYVHVSVLCKVQYLSALVHDIDVTGALRYVPKFHVIFLKQHVQYSSLFSFLFLLANKTMFGLKTNLRKLRYHNAEKCFKNLMKERSPTSKYSKRAEHVQHDQNNTKGENEWAILFMQIEKRSSFSTANHAKSFVFIERTHVFRSCSEALSASWCGKCSRDTRSSLPRCSNTAR